MFFNFFHPATPTYWPEVLGTLIIIIGVFSLIYFSSFIIQKQDWGTIKKKQYLSFIRNLALVLGLCLLFFTWRGEIKAFIFSVSALTVGMMVAFKEVILSFFSYFIISSNKLFKIGDIIEIDDKAGKVVDRSLLYTKLSLIATNHGKEVVIPNVLFSTGKFVNLSAEPFFSKIIPVYTVSCDLTQKIEYLSNYLTTHLAGTASTFDFYMEPQNSCDIVIKIVVKHIDGANFDFNTFKNKAYCDFFALYPVKERNFQN